MNNYKTVQITNVDMHTITLTLNGKMFSVPRELYDGDLKTGDTIHVCMVSEGQQNKDQAHLAKSILNSLFGHHGERKGK